MLTDNFVTMEIGKAKHIALVAHDGKKKELIEWCDRNKEVLQGHFQNCWICGSSCETKCVPRAIRSYSQQKKKQKLLPAYSSFK